jgi:hypothetical protein
VACAWRMSALSSRRLQTSEWRYPTRGHHTTETGPPGNLASSTNPKANRKTRHTCYLPAHVVGVAESETLDVQFA